MECGPVWGEVTNTQIPLTSAAILPSVTDSRLHMKDNTNNATVQDDKANYVTLKEYNFRSRKLSCHPASQQNNDVSYFTGRRSEFCVGHIQ